MSEHVNALVKKPGRQWTECYNCRLCVGNSNVWL